ncbi:MAG: hypothetical protein APR63_12325 [Desulfuromonas sp. SDB]|nr:MAG: hypothetical protein APR63_12325 [Desulfuromonas sp. SDB]
MMQEKNLFGVQQEQQEGVNVKEVIGIILIIIGLLIALWTFKSVYELFTKPEITENWTGIISQGIEIPVETLEKQTSLLIPADFFSYLLPILLLSIAVSISGILIKGGVELLYGSYQKYKTRLSSIEYRLSKKIDSLRN